MALESNTLEPRQGKRMRQIAAVLEVIGVYTAGQLVGYLLGLLLGIPFTNPLADLSAQTTPAELLSITGRLASVLFLQYSGWFALAFLVGWWHRRRGPRQYGLTRAGHSMGYIIGAGVVLFAIAELPVRLWENLALILPLDATTDWRAAMYALDWSSPAFWLLMFVGSYGLIPLLEELFYRGYCQTRLEEDLGAPAAIVAVAFLFTFSHGQYLMLNLYHIGLLIAFLFGALLWGYIYYRTRSLWVTVVAHILVNFPLKGAATWAMLVAMLIVCVLARREISQYFRDGIAFFRTAALGKSLFPAALGFALFAIAFNLLSDIIILLGIVLFIIAVVLEALERKRRISVA